jgi:hypothetical protein
MPIIGTLPNNIQNGNTVDATPVMADFNFIINQVNANANPTGTFTAPSGTTMGFQQASAPTGWVAQTSTGYDDAVLHSVIPANFVGASGTNTAIQFLQAGWNTNMTVLSIAQMPAHNHADAGHNHGVTDPGHSHAVQYDNTTGGGTPTNNGLSAPTNLQTFTATTGITINTGTANIQNTGGGGGHNHSSNFQMKLVDFITAVKT